MQAPSTTSPIVYYTSAHGYGHGVRSCDIIRALLRRHNIPVHVVSGLAESFLSTRLPAGGWSYREKAFDVGMVQLDSIRVDLEATLEAVEALVEQREDLVAGEMKYLESVNARLVVADIPSFPLEAAKAMGLPALAVSNFSWHWIYGSLKDHDSRWLEMADIFGAGYAGSDLLLKLPLSEPMEIFPRQEPIPLVASAGHRRRDDLAATTGADPDRQWALLSFTSIDLDDDALDRIAKIREWAFFTVDPLHLQKDNCFSVPREVLTSIPFTDIVASVDAVISKPGFGILSECIVNQVPLLFVEREDFIEYEVLVHEIRRYLKHLHLPAADLYAGKLEPYLENIDNQPDPPENLGGGGDTVAADRVMTYFNG